MRFFFILTICVCFLLIAGGFLYGKYGYHMEHFIEIAKESVAAGGDNTNRRAVVIQISGGGGSANNTKVVVPPNMSNAWVDSINQQLQYKDSRYDQVVDGGVDDINDEGDVEEEEPIPPEPASCPSTSKPASKHLPTRIPWFLPNFQTNAYVPEDVLAQAQPTEATEAPEAPAVATATLEPTNAPEPQTLPPSESTPRPRTTPTPTPTPTFEFEILKRKKQRYTTEPPQTTEPPSASSYDDGMGTVDVDGTGLDTQDIPMTPTPTATPSNNDTNDTTPQPQPQPSSDGDFASFEVVPTPSTPNNTIFEVGSTLTEEQAKSVLAFHNEMRAKHGAPPLEWDAALARIAQKYVDTCPEGHSDTPYGENLAWGYDNIELGAQAWYNEDFDFDNATLEEDSGHFTQMIWMDTKRMGCGQNLKCNGLNTERAYACYYDPAGNVMGVDWNTKVKRPIY